MHRPNYGLIRFAVIAALCIAASCAYAQTSPGGAARPGIAEGTHLYEAAKTDSALAKAFASVMKPVLKGSVWVKTYGTTAPSAVETMDDRTYIVFQGCKPHDCVTESYAVMYEQATGKIYAVFVKNGYDGPALKGSRLTWLGKPEFDQARVLGKYLF
jgi:hypothetical protein